MHTINFRYSLIVKIPSIPNNVYLTLEDSLSSPVSLFLLSKHLHYRYFFNKSYLQLKYDKTLYQNSQNCSPRFQHHLMNVTSFIKRFSSSEWNIAEIGCGKGDFLDILSQQGFVNLAGFDSAYEGSNPLIQNRYFSEEDTGFNADMIIMRHTLEHIPFPFDFLRKLLSINSNNNASIVIEVPCFDWIVNHQSWWDLSYEHCNYFTIESFKSIFPNCTIEKVFDNQYLLVKADYRDIIDPPPSLNEFEDVDVKDIFLFFRSSDIHDSDLDFTKNNFNEGRYWIWGSATKGVLMLYHLKSMFFNYKSPLGCIDINPSKQTRYLPSLGYQVMSPEFLYSNIQDGDIIVITNPTYKSEIISLLYINTDSKFEVFCL